MPMPPVTLDAIRANPEAAYASPQDLVNDQRLSLSEKKSLLESWELDARRLAEATAEGMGGGEEAHLREVAKARLAVDLLLQQEGGGAEEADHAGAGLPATPASQAQQ